MLIRPPKHIREEMLRHNMPTTHPIKGSSATSTYYDDYVEAPIWRINDSQYIQALIEQKKLYAWYFEARFCAPSQESDT